MTHQQEEVEAYMQHGYSVKPYTTSSGNTELNYCDANKIKSNFEFRETHNVDALPTTLLHLSLHTCFTSPMFDLLG